MERRIANKLVFDAEIETKDPGLRNILQLLFKKRGTDFSHYKVSTIKRRIERRISENKLKDINAYSLFLKKKSDEIDLLYEDLLIGVTSFFRDDEPFDYLKNRLLPRLLKNKKKGEVLRIWVPGCSTGEEAYSLAMLLHEIQQTKSEKVPFQIFATDLNEKAILKARNGEYTAQDVSNISPKRLQRFFTLSRDKYRINQNLREVCVFSVHNLLSDPAFSRMDLISCCNLLIYLDSAAQRKVISSFAFGLKEGGYLMLGKSETTGTSAPHFTPIHKKLKIYVKKKTDKNGEVLKPDLRRYSESAKVLKKSVLNSLGTPATAGNGSLTTAIDSLLLNSYLPACAVINQKLEVLLFRGDTSPFFKLAGKASLNILKIARPDFLFELRNAIDTAMKSKRVVRKTNIESRLDGDLKVFSLEVAPLKVGGEEPLFLIIFKENEVVEIIPDNLKRPKDYDRLKDRKLKKLEQELALARTDMQQNATEQEAIIEELQSANEEIVSSNEELRTVNEELETSKEEIQATNEELISSNRELQKRNEEIEALNNYSNLILATIPDPMLILDRNMHVKSANDQFLKTFRLKEEDVTGISVFKLDKSSWNIPELKSLLNDTIRNKKNLKKQEITHKFGALGEKVLVFSAKLVSRRSKGEQLTLLIIEDITEEKRKEQELKQKEKEMLAAQIESQAKIDAHARSLMFLESVFMNAPFPISIFRGTEHRYELINDYAKKLVGNRELIGLKAREAFPEVESQGYFDLLDNVYRTGVPYVGKESYLQFDRVGDGTMHEAYFNFVYQPLFDLEGKKIDGILSVAMEVTDQVLARKKIEQSEAQFVALADNIQNLAWMADRTGWVYWYNKRWYEYTGTAQKETEGWGWQTVHDPKYLPDVLGRWKQSIKTGSPFEMIFPVKGADGIFRQFLTRIHPIKDERGRVMTWIGTSTDVHEQKSFSDELEKAVHERTLELLEANRSLQKANEQLNSFNYISSHDLQEPLRKIRTFSNLINKEERNNLSVTGKEYLFRMEQTVSRMQQLLDDLLAYSRTRTTEKAFEPADLNLLVDYVKKDFEETIAEKKAVIETINLGKANVITFQFKQLIQNLIGNSLKFAKKDTPPHIRIEGRRVTGAELQDIKLSPKTDYHYLSFTDNGIGFEPKYKDKIFEIFQRLHDREEYPGTGIGLAIVKRIVENHNGFIYANGQPQEGARFDIYIPASTLQPAREEHAVRVT
ncbi:MAG TPA: CheR family methyltransferase [Chryseosolibacter sp.]|nr:CheR family methyltransferase [Chryseosolibacter sp.]